MAKKKFYVIKGGAYPGLYDSWEVCRERMESGGGSCRGFATKDEAEQFLSGKEEIVPEFDGLIAYVDGSFSVSDGRYAFGCVLIAPDGTITEQSGSGNNPESANLRNVTGEMLGAMYAVKWAMARGYRRIDIRYDYEGIEKWVTKVWKSKTELTQKYAAAMQDWGAAIHINFTKIAAHTGNKYNERADALAKKAIEDALPIPGFKE